MSVQIPSNMFIEAAEEASLRAAADPFAALLEHSRTAVEALEAKLSAALLSTDAVADQLDSQYRGLYDAKALLEAELRTSVAEVAAQREATAQANVALQQVKVTAAETSAELAQVQVRVHALEADNRRLVERLATKQEEVIDVAKETDQVRATCSTLREKLGAEEARAAEATATAGRAKIEASRASQEKAALEANNQYLSEQLEERSQTLVQLRRENASSTAELKGQVSQLRSELEIAVDRRESLNAELQKMQKEKAALEEDYKNEKATSTEAIASLEEELETVRRLSALREDAADQASQIAEERLDVIKALKEGFEKKGEECRALSEKADKLEEEANTLKAALASQPQGKGLQTESLNQLARVSPAAAQAVMMREGLTLAEMFEKMQEAEEAAARAVTARDELEEYLDQILGELEEKAPLVAAQQRDYDVMKASFDAVVKQRDEAKEKAATAEKQLYQSEQKLRNALEESNFLQKRLKDMDHRVASVLQDVDKHMPEQENVNVHAIIAENSSLTIEVERLKRRMRDALEKQEKEFEDRAKENAAEIERHLEAMTRAREMQTKQINELKRKSEVLQKLYDSSHTGVLHNEEVQHLKSLLEEATKEKETIATQAEKNVKLATEQLLQAKHESTDANRSLKLLENELEFQKKRMDEILNRNKSLTMEVDKLLSRNNAVESRQLDLENNSLLLTQERESIKESLAVEKNKAVRLEAQIEILRKDCERAEKMAEQSSEESRQSLITMQQITAQYETSAASAKAELDRSRKEVLGLERQIVELTEAITAEKAKSADGIAAASHAKEKAQEEVSAVERRQAETLEAKAAADTQAAAATARAEELEKSLLRAEAKLKLLLSSNEGDTILQPTEDHGTPAKLSDIQKENASLQQEIAKWKRNADQYKAMHKASEELLQVMQQSQESMQKQADEMQKSLEKSIEDLKAENAKDKALQAEEKKRADVLERNLLQSQKDRDGQSFSYQQEVSKLEMEVKTAENKIATLEKEVTDANSAWKLASQNYEMEINSHSEHVKQLTKMRDELQQAIFDRDAWKEKLKEQERKTLSSELTANASAKRLSEINSSFEKQINALKEQNSALHRRLENITAPSGSDAEISDKDAQIVISFLRREKEGLECAKLAAEAEARRYKATLAVAKKEVETLKLEVVTERAKQSQSKPDSEQNRQLDMVQQLSILRESNNTLRIEKTELTAKTIKLEAQVKAIEGENAAVEKEMSKLKAEFGTLTARLAQAEKEKIDWRARASAAVSSLKKGETKETEELRKSLEENKKELEAIRAKEGEALKEAEREKSERSKVQKEALNLQKRIQTTSSKNLELVKQSRGYQTEILSLKNEIEAAKAKASAAASSTPQKSADKSARDAQQQRILALEKEKEELVKNKESLSERYEKLNGEFKKLMEKMKKVTPIVRKLRTENEALKEKITKLGTTVEKPEPMDVGGTAAEDEDPGDQIQQQKDTRAESDSVPRSAHEASEPSAILQIPDQAATFVTEAETSAQGQAQKPDMPALPSAAENTSIVDKGTSTENANTAGDGSKPPVTETGPVGGEKKAVAQKADERSHIRTGETRKRINPLKRGIDSASALPSSQAAGSKGEGNPMQAMVVDEATASGSQMAGSTKEADPEPPSKLRKDEADASISDAKPLSATGTGNIKSTLEVADTTKDGAQDTLESKEQGSKADSSAAGGGNQEDEAKKKDPIKKKLYALVGKGSAQDRLAAEAVADASKTPGERATSASTKTGRGIYTRGQGRLRGRGRRGRQSERRGK